MSAESSKPRSGRRDPSTGGQAGTASAPAGWGRDVLQCLPDAVLLADDGVVVFANEAMQRLSGLPRAELEGALVEALFTDGLRAAPAGAREGRHAEELAAWQEGLVALRRGDGTELPVQVALAALEVDGHGLTVVTLREVGAREEAEAAAAVDRLGRILDLVPDGVIVVDPVTERVEGVNHAATLLLGRTEEELRGMPVSGLAAAEESPEGGEAAQEVLLSHGQHLRLQRLVARDGSVIDCEVHASRVDGPSGRPLLVNVVREVRERLRLEQRLRETEASFRTAFEKAPVGMALVRRSDEGAQSIVRTNAALEEMFGFAGRELVGLDPEVLGPVSAGVLAEPATRPTGGAQPSDRSVVRRYQRRDGSVLWAEVRATQLDMSSTDGGLVLLHVVDTTRRVAGERSLRRNAVVDQCVAEVSRAALEGRTEAELIDRVAAGVLEALDADAAAVLVAGAADLSDRRWAATAGAAAAALTASLDAPASERMLLRVAAGRTIVRGPEPSTAGTAANSLGPALLTPFGRGGSPTHGVVAAARLRDRHGFTPGETERLGRLVRQSRVAVDLARARSDQQRLALLDERQRIARDLHDTVIQDIIAVGMQINADIDAESDPGRQARDLDKVTQLESATRNLRRAVFELRSTVGRVSMAAEVTRVLGEASRVLGHFPAVTFAGPVDELPADLADDVVATLREALANVARHARASRTAVSLVVEGGSLTLSVDDDGVGPGEWPRTGYGIGNLEQRARRHGGHVSMGAAPVVGTRLVWTCPVPASPGVG